LEETLFTAASSVLSLCRKGFGHVLQVNQQLISILDDKAGAEIDLDNATLRVTLDVIGRVGFGKDFGATRDLNSGKANLAFDMMEAGVCPLRVTSSWVSGKQKAAAKDCPLYLQTSTGNREEQVFTKSNISALRRPQ